MAGIIGISYLVGWFLSWIIGAIIILKWPSSPFQYDNDEDILLAIIMGLMIGMIWPAAIAIAIIVTPVYFVVKWAVHER